MTPPWPSKSFNLQHPVRRVAFSPSGSQLALCLNISPGQCVVNVLDRWGKETLLGGHARYIYCLEYSLDGEYLASASADLDYGSIRIWSNRESCHATSSKTRLDRPTRLPQQADINQLGSYPIMALSFSRTDPNLLASGGSQGEIKVWNVKEQACIHTFDCRPGPIRSLFFAGGADSACIALKHTGSIIRLWRAEGASDFANETIGEADIGVTTPYRSMAFSPTGSFVAASFGSRTRNKSSMSLYELETMTKTQSIVMRGSSVACVAVSPDSKQLVYGDHEGRIRLLQTDDFSTERDIDIIGEAAAQGACSAAFDPTCRFLAVGCPDGRLELRSL
jgi:WD40 repeat protein